MASTSTGFNKSLILKRMPSSSGQTQEFSSGCKLNMKVDSEIEMESGSTFNIESGAYVKFASGSYMQVPIVSHTSLTLALAACGVSIITASTTGKVAKTIFTLAQPKAGMRKSLVQGCTFVQIVRASSTPKAIYFGTTKILSLSLPKTTKGKFNMTLELMARSTIYWAMVNRSTAGVNTITASTVCT